MIEFISDTVTRPTKEMLQAMMQAEVGDDVFEQDPTVNRLQGLLAALFGHESALFCPSGTMTNQLAIKCNTQPLDEMICDISSHVYQYETAGYAYNSGIAVNLLHGDHGKITPEMIENAIKPDHDWLPNSRLVVIENSCNRGGGSYYTLEEMKKISKLCRSRGLRCHLDGARLFNVLVETGDHTRDIGPLFDSISICLSKGLGAPAGSVLIGDRDFIKKARKFRKVMGGGMRQAGFLAAAGIYALENNIERLADDNQRARLLGKALEACDYVHYVRPVHTNIVIFDLKDTVNPKAFVSYLLENGVNPHYIGHQSIRFVTHLDLNDEMISKAIDILNAYKP